MRKYISVSEETITKIRRTFRVKGRNICERCVKNALAYRTHNELATKIRFMAMQNGGVVYVIDKEMECWHDADGVMHQVFPNGAELHLDKNTGKGIVYDTKGRIAVLAEHVILKQIPELQRKAESL